MMRSIASRVASVASRSTALSAGVGSRKVAGTTPVTMFATRAMSAYTFDLPEFKLWEGTAADQLKPLPSKADVTAEEMLDYYAQMFLIRRCEITSDVEYKARNIRGFCHLYDGQEAVAMGLEAGLDREDSITTTYRCHGFHLTRGGTVEGLFAEMFGFANGVSAGKGGSMHLYNGDTNFWGGAGIVGAQVPVGTGVAWANKLKYKREDGTMPVSASLYGDGAANQGQVWEAANIAALWKLPAIYVIENNQYGMGTSVDRHSCNTEYYTSGGRVLPGIQVNGMDVLAVREGMKYAKDYSGSGNGPMFVEIKTYRYHGHSMSDPGITYRDRDEVSNVRQNQDCIASLKERILSTGAATEGDLKDLEKKVRADVTAGLKAAKAGAMPDLKERDTDIIAGEPYPFIRGVEYKDSVFHSSQY